MEPILSMQADVAKNEVNLSYARYSRSGSKEYTQP